MLTFHADQLKEFGRNFHGDNLDLAVAQSLMEYVTFKFSNIFQKYLNFSFLQKDLNGAKMV